MKYTVCYKNFGSNRRSVAEFSDRESALTFYRAILKTNRYTSELSATNASGKDVTKSFNKECIHYSVYFLGGDNMYHYSGSVHAGSFAEAAKISHGGFTGFAVVPKNYFKSGRYAYIKIINEQKQTVAHLDYKANINAFLESCAA